MRIVRNTSEPANAVHYTSTSHRFAPCSHSGYGGGRRNAAVMFSVPCLTFHDRMSGRVKMVNLVGNHI